MPEIKLITLDGLTWYKVAGISKPFMTYGLAYRAAGKIK